MLTRLKSNLQEWGQIKASLQPRNRFIIDLAETILVSILIVLLFRQCLFQSSKVVSGSMISTLMINDRVIVSKYPFRFRTPQRGDIVLFNSPLGDKKEYVKRIIGVGGDTVRITNGRVYINEAPLFFPGAVIRKDYFNLDSKTIPEDHYFVLGDNRRNSHDSRYWDNPFVPHSELIGQANFIYWPLSRAQVLR